MLYWNKGGFEMKFWYKITFTVLVSQFFVLIFGFFSNKKIDLVLFVNGNFYIGLFVLMAGLFVMISRNGFFDVITTGIRHIFFRKQMEQDEEEYRSFSILLSFSHIWMITSGIILTALSIIFYILGYSIDS